VAGLVLSGVLADVFSYAAGAYNRLYIARTISKAERMVAADNYEEAIKLYEKAYAKISSSMKDGKNMVLAAKINNNKGLCISKRFERTKNIIDFNEALSLFKEARETYKKIQNGELADQTEKNIKTLEEMFKNI